MRKTLLTALFATVLGLASYGVASLGSSTTEAEACGYHEPRPAANVAGVYQSNYGEVVLEQSGARITGRYVCCGGGTITGRMRGTQIHYSWQQPGARGQGVWTFQKGTLIGTWGYDSSSSSGGAWNLAPRPQVVATWRD